jgi:Fe-S-cluster-containing dehydrogenase component
MACKIGNGLSDEAWWSTVRTLGSGEGIDRPSGVWPELAMQWIPIFSKKCVLCSGRTAKGEQPFCVYNCPTRALTYGDVDDPQSAFCTKAEELKTAGFRVFELPAWEDSKAGITYASRR